MARSFVRASSQDLTGTGNFDFAGGPLSVAFSYNPATTANSGWIIKWNKSGGGATGTYIAIGSIGGGFIQALRDYTTQYLYRESATGLFSNGTLYRVVCTHDGSTNGTGWKFYIDGTEQSYGADQNATGTAVDTLGAVSIGSRDSDFYIDANLISEVGAWSVELSADEAIAYARGFSPLAIRQAGLEHYWPLIGRYSPEIDLCGGASLTLNNTPATVDHQRVIYPRRRWDRSPGSDVQIIDDTAFTYAGGWNTDTNGAVYGGSFHLTPGAGSGTRTARVTVSGLAAGVPVYVAAGFKVAPFSNASNAPVTIYDSDGTTVLRFARIDQTTDWKDFTDSGLALWLIGSAAPSGTSLQVEFTDNANAQVLVDVLWVSTTNPITEDYITAIDGPWGTQSTWGMSSIPSAAANKSVRCKHALSVTDDQSIGNGTAYNAFYAPIGTLTIEAGASLTCRGHAIFSRSGIDGAASVDRLHIKTGGALIFDGNSGVGPVLYGYKNTNFKLAGTTPANAVESYTTSDLVGMLVAKTNFACIRKKATEAGDASDSAGNDWTLSGAPLPSVNGNAWCFMGNGTLDMGPLEVGVFGAANCDLILTNGFGYKGSNWIGLRTTASNTDMTFEHNVVDGTVGFVRVTNPVQSIYINGENLDNKVGVGHAWKFNHNSIRSGLVIHNYVGGLQCRGNYCFGSMGGGGFSNQSYGDCGDNFIYVGQWGEGGGIMGGLKDSYMFFDPASVDPLGTGFTFIYGTDTTLEFSGNIYDQQTGHPRILIHGATEGAGVDRLIEGHGNLLIHKGAGMTILFESISVSATGKTAKLRAYQNTCIIGNDTLGAGTDRAPFVCYGIGQQVVRQIQDCFNNILYRAASGPGSGRFVTFNRPYTASPPAAPLTDSLRAIDARYNAYKGHDTLAAGSYSGTAGDTDVEANTAYNGPMSGSTPPGANDFIDVDPEFFDQNLRDLYQWAVTKGCSAGATNAQKRDYAADLISRDLSLVIELRTWTFTGYRPTNAALKNAGEGGVTPGAAEFTSGLFNLLFGNIFGNVFGNLDPCISDARRR